MAKHQKGSKVNKYLTNMTPILFDDLKGAISQRIEGYDFHQRWYVLVPFSLFWYLDHSLIFLVFLLIAESLLSELTYILLIQH